MNEIEICGCDQSLELQEILDIVYRLLTSKQKHKIENSIRCLQNKVSKKVKKILVS